MDKKKRSKVKNELAEALIIGIPTLAFAIEILFYIFGNKLGMLITFAISSILMFICYMAFCREPKNKRRKRD